MKKIIVILLICGMGCSAPQDKGNPSYYLQNRAPLEPCPYLELPLGTIHAESWLQDQLIRMKTGMTGHLDELYPEVVGPRNGWLGGDGDGWERGPYWIDGLLPLAYILDDDGLKAKVQPWIEWTLTHQAEDGYIGPVPFESPPADEPGLQRGMRRDWWPKMVMLKVLRQYYSATGDERVIRVLTNYFHYQLKELPETPLDHWTFWADRRGGDNLMTVYWLYNITGDKALLDLGRLISEQTFPWKEVFQHPVDSTTRKRNYFGAMKRYPFDQNEISSLSVAQHSAMHGVNLAQGLKEPVVFYQQDKKRDNIEAVNKLLKDLKEFHGQPQGMYGADEGLHGASPVQGIELCSIAEMMFSLETMLTITGDQIYADLIERIAYNALPTQTTDDYSGRQYFQAANQTELSDRIDPSFQSDNHQNTDFVYGLLTGYPCCTTNMHQSWPKFVQNLWYATADRGVACLLYGPSEVTLQVGDGITATIREKTLYPFREKVDFEIALDHPGEFPFHLRIPGWCQTPEITINGEKWNGPMDSQLAKITRTWKDGDRIRLVLPMQTQISYWYDSSATVEHGPLVYALRVRGEERVKDRKDRFGPFREVYPLDPWNFGLLAEDLEHSQSAFVVQELPWNGGYPWNLENVPLRMTARGVRLPSWSMTAAGPVLPDQPSVKKSDIQRMDSLILVPYGATTLRITEFPVVGR